MKNKYYIDDQGRLNMFFNAAPYSGPIKGKDLQGHRFTKNTDFGPLTQALSYLDHNNIAKSHPEIANLPGISDRLGVAYREMSEDEGLVYRIIVDERYRYKNMLKALMDIDALDASATAYGKSFKLDEKTGEVLTYEVVEVSPTWKPANPHAENIFKSIIMKELEMADETNKDAVVQDAAAETDTSAAVSETPVTDAVTAMFGEGESATEKSIPEALVELTQMVANLAARFDAYDTRQEATEKSIKDFSLAIPKMGELLAKNLKATVVDDSKRSPVEKAVVQQFQQQAAAGGAPGRELKSSVAKN